MILTIWLLMKRKLSVGMSMKIWGWYTFAWHQCTISWQWSIGTRICGASLYNNVTSLRWFDTKFDERDACDDAIGWWMLWVHGSIVTSMTPSFCCRIFLRDDFEAGEKKGWDFKQEMKSLKNRRAFEVGFIFFRPVRCASYFRVFFLWARSMEVLLCAPFAGGLCDVWIVSFLHFEFDFVSFYLSAFAVSGFCQSWRIGRIGHFFRRKTRRMRPSGESHGCSISLLLLGFRSRQYSRGTEVFLAILYISHESCI